MPIGPAPMMATSREIIQSIICPRAIRENGSVSLLAMKVDPGRLELPQRSQPLGHAGFGLGLSLLGRLAVGLGGLEFVDEIDGLGIVVDRSLQAPQTSFRLHHVDRD